MGHSALPLLCALGLVDAFETVDEWLARRRASGRFDPAYVKRCGVRFFPR